MRTTPFEPLLSWNIQRTSRSARFAYFEKSSSSPPHGNGVSVPARAAHSHSSSVGSRTVSPIRPESHMQNAFASSQLTRTTGMRRWFPMCPGSTVSLPCGCW